MNSLVESPSLPLDRREHFNPLSLICFSAVPLRGSRRRGQGFQRSPSASLTHRSSLAAPLSPLINTLALQRPLPE